MNNKINVLLDMETGDPDDVITLCILASNPNINLLAVTVMPGTNEQIGLVKLILKEASLNIPVGSYRIGYPKKCVSNFYYKWLGDFQPQNPDDLGYVIINGIIKSYPDVTILSTAPLKYFKNIPLIGSMFVDEEGVESQAVKLVDKGRLKSLITSRMPHKRIYESNGHGRGYPANAFFTNLFVSSEKTESKDMLKKQLIELCKDMGLEHGIIIRKIDNPHFKQSRLSSADEYYGQEASPPFVLQPILVYKVYFDGKEEFVRGTEITCMAVNSFKEIVGASDSYFVYNHFTDQHVQSMYDKGEARVSVITPSLLFESIDLKNNPRLIRNCP
jgi:hypothetical protein